MDYLLYGLALATLVSTLAGGLLILKFSRKLPFFFAFAAGSIIAVAFLDILPEALDSATANGIEFRTVFLVVVGAFFFYSLLEKYFATHQIHGEGDSHDHPHVLGPIGAGSLVVHSFFDGVAIGVAFQVSASAGLIVALAVILHDMTDGINTVVVMLRNKQTKARAIQFLVMDALAPVIGLIVASTFVLPAEILVYLLAFFVGEFIYIGAATLVPEARTHPSKKTILVMGAGIILIAFLTSLLHV